MRNCYQSDNCGVMPQTMQPGGCATPCGYASGGTASRAASPCGCASNSTASPCGCASNGTASPCGCTARGTASYTAPACGNAVPVNCTCFLTIATVPWQQFTKSYEPEQALMRGTMFPELDKPFLGRSVRS